MLVILRVTIGWHFLYQGLWKLENPDFSSAGFLAQSKGPLEDRYLALIPDYWGHERLDKVRALAAIKDFRQRFERAFELTEEQKSLVDRITASRTDQVQSFFKDNSEAIETYFHDLERLADTKASPASELDFQKKRNWSKRQELQGKLKSWTDELDTGMRQFRTDLNNVLTSEQRQVRQMFDADTFTTDDFITLSNVAIGFCLMVGLFTRLAALGAGVFLALIVLSQPELPGIYPPAPAAAGRSLIVTKEFIEAVACFCLATLPVGRWGGLDFFVHHVIVRPFFGTGRSVA
jgi:uncharacterized membrane protein YphA (DoxX/SURF4 family)